MSSTSPRDDTVAAALNLGSFSTEFHVLLLDCMMLSQCSSSMRKLHGPEQIRSLDKTTKENEFVMKAMFE